jgi:cytochrome c5
MLKPLLLLPAVLMLGYCAVPAVALTPQAGSSTPAANVPKTGTEVPTHVKKIYEVDCALCHGANGNGKTDLAADMKLQLEDWTDPRALASKSDQQLFDLIRQGKDKMPPEGEGRAKNDDLRALIVYIRSMSKGAPTAPVAPAAPAATSPGTR